MLPTDAQRNSGKKMIFFICFYKLLLYLFSYLVILAEIQKNIYAVKAAGLEENQSVASHATFAILSRMDLLSLSSI